MFKILVTTKFRDRVVKYAQTVRELVVNSSGRCGRIRASAWQCAPCHDCHELPRIVHEQFTKSSRHVRELVCVAAWEGLPTETVTCTSRIDVTSSLRLVHALHEQFAHGTRRSRRVHEQFTNSSRTVHEYCATVALVGGYVYRAGQLIAIPVIVTASHLSVLISRYISFSETTCLIQSRHEEQSREGQKPTGQRQRWQRSLREIIPPSHPYQVSISRRHSKIHLKARDSH